MPRPLRIQIPGGFYHVITRGNHREPLFGGSPKDRRVLSALVKAAVERCGIRVHGFCYMTNHLHFIIQASMDQAQRKKPLSGAMKFIKEKYASYRHRELQTTGHLYERRFKSYPIESDRHFLAVLKYIHFNPVKAGMCFNPIDHEWSSHAAYLGKAKIDWLTRDFALALLGEDENASLIAYRELMRHMGDELDEELSYLKRKYRGAPERKEPKPKDKASYKRMAKLLTPPARPKNATTLPQLAEKTCLDHSIKVEDLCSPSRERSLCKIRAKFACTAIKEHIANLAAVAKFLNRHPSALCRLVNKHEPLIDPSLLDPDWM